MTLSGAGRPGATPSNDTRGNVEEAGLRAAVGGRKGFALRFDGGWKGGRRRSFAAVVLLVPLLCGCASSRSLLVRPAPESLPLHSPLRVSTLAESDAWLRHHLVMRQPAAALSLFEPDSPVRPSDSLLEALQRALVLREAGEFEESNAALERAEREAEQRAVPSASRTAGSYLLSEGLLSWVPEPAETAMIPYYRMMNHLELGDVDGAAVEARRLSTLLLHSGAGDDMRCSSHGMLHYVAAMAFEAAGEANDALVSLRQADASFAACPGGRAAAAPGALGRDLVRLASRLGITEVVDSAAVWYPGTSDLPDAAPTGEVVLLLERGFVAHRRESTVHVPILDHELDDLDSGDSEKVAEAAAVVAARLVDNFVERGYWGRSWDDHPAVQIGHAFAGAHILKLAWPTLVEPEPPRSELRILAAADTLYAAPVADLSSAAAIQLESERKAMLVRLVTRGIFKYLVSREMEKKAEEKGGEVFGFLAGRLANLAANESERADTRSWTLLPDDVAVVRLSLPPGVHDLDVQTVAPSGTVLGSVSLPPIEVTAGGVTMVSRRLWADASELDEGDSTTE